MYLDPGFGSMIIQLVVAMIAGVGAVWLLTKNKMKAWFHRGKRAEDNAEGMDEAEDAIAEACGEAADAAPEHEPVEDDSAQA